MGPIVVIKRIGNCTGRSGVENMSKHESDSRPVSLRISVIIVVSPLKEIWIVLCTPGEEGVLFVVRLSMFLSYGQKPC